MMQNLVGDRHTFYIGTDRCPHLLPFPDIFSPLLTVTISLSHSIIFANGDACRPKNKTECVLEGRWLEISGRRKLILPEIVFVASSGFALDH
ncbi:hypothetical protein L6452_38757 [Arctium lappa]|uniref:Uncharacterized protein n=1 Tax=Arctium lappa TaxID=4217 RepID=A0ACB8XPZ1_ARCLA|nr:hypothetical protein L6452_38757 [Arctium lappa]